MVQTAANPRILCVVIPALNEELLIGRCIESLLRCGFTPPDIYVVDDGSADNTALIAKGFGVNVLRNETNQGKAKSIRRILDHFYLVQRYEYIAFLDADTHVGRGYLKAVINAFKKNPKAVVVSGQPKSNPHNWLTAYRAFSYFIAHCIYKPSQSIMSSILVAPGCTSVFKTSIISELDWNSDTVVDDMDITIQVHRKRLGRVIYNKQMMTFTQDPRLLSCYIGQMNRWYMGTWQVAKKHKMPLGFQMVDLEFAYLLGEGLLISAFTVLLPIWVILYPKMVLMLLAWELLLIAVIAVISSVKERRTDVLKYFPIFYFIKILDCVLLLRSFIYSFTSGLFLKKSSDLWFRPRRYDYKYFHYSDR